VNIRGAGVPCVISGIVGGGGSVALNWQGEWNIGTAYSEDDLVEYNGSSYICLQDNTGQQPDGSPLYWDLFAAKGDTGSTGAPGAPGADGDGTAYYGQMSNQSSQTINITTANTFVDMAITGTFDTANSYGLIAPSVSSTFGIKNNTGATQLLHFIATADIATSNNNAVGLKLAKNGTPLNETQCQAPTGTGGSNFAKVMTQWMIELDDGDEVSMFVANITGTDNLDILRAKIVAITPGRQGEEGPPGAPGANGTNGTNGTNGQGFTWLGAWDNSTAYVAYDVVEEDGSTYVAIAGSTNVVPGTDPTKWELVASKGDTGANGAPGAPGADGTGSWSHPVVVTANTGTGNAEYTLPGAGEEMVWKGGAIQIRGTDYTRTGNDITFVGGNVPVAGEDVTVTVAQNNLLSTDALTLNGATDSVTSVASTIVKRGTDSTIKADNHASIGSSGAAGTAVILDSNGLVPSAALPPATSVGFAEIFLLMGG
jgi:hypothetical protein